MKHGFPFLRPGMTVGLLGGSFDPAHMGHVQISRAALKHFGLDRVWWLVSPGNPLKRHQPAPLQKRMQAARQIMRHPRILISDAEAQLGTRYTAQTLRHLRRLYPGVRFVWLMGADNLAQFHRWKDWRDIMETVPIGVLARPGDRISARLSPAAQIYAHARLKGNSSHLLAHAQSPAWCFINVPMVDASSSAIRANGNWSATQEC
ncbi:nicotinate-nucleotide adenylyltransferase [Parasedimentitalea maritima]|uniref:Probable nicotinate-nucleotide adenylyltransferase n=1 Tax=Parasedimentitalea maritima TaxID=2578117 RepID=A0ABY2URU0_9RHOB|nr:nicotinate-nucleotide adenylyltransferase [Zongyanglinia marina]TLP59465.1 nicotinate-nucleotide adenylyltransferase [Zongyanglinia marina]